MPTLRLRGLAAACLPLALVLLACTAGSGTTATPTPQVQATQPFLDWNQVESGTFPTTFVPEGRIDLTGGNFSRATGPGSATPIQATLKPIRGYGDIDGDGDYDAVAILVKEPGTGRSVVTMGLVENLDGNGVVRGVVVLGADVVVRSLDVVNGQVVVSFLTEGPDDQPNHPTQLVRRWYDWVNGEFVLSRGEIEPRAGLALPAAPDTVAIQFAPGATFWATEGQMVPNGIRDYTLQARGGQQLDLTIESKFNDVVASVFLPGTPPTVLVSVLEGVPRYTGTLPRDGNYVIQVVSLGGAPRDFRMTVSVTGGPAAAAPATPTAAPKPAATPAATTAPTAVPAPTVQPTPTTAATAVPKAPTTVPAKPVEPRSAPAPKATPALPGNEDNVIYLTFDDGPSTYTQRVQALLAQYGATATFFVIGSQAAAQGDLIRATHGAGHGLGNHTYNHASLVTMNRDEFLQDIRRAQEAVAPLGSMCLRPPYGATDARSRALAAELGFRLVLWDIDTRDWSRPGVQAIVNEAVGKARPGAIILFHDGGGDRSQTLTALETILPNLREQGYRLVPVCR